MRSFLLASGALLAASAIGGRRRRGSRSFRPLRDTPTGYTLSPLPFIDDTFMEEGLAGVPEDELGFFHVTTHLDGVLKRGVLSRRQLRRQGHRGAGLGGGVGDDASDQVSLGLTRDGALRVLSTVRMMARAVHGQISAEDALEQMKEACEPTMNVLDGALDYLEDMEDVAEVYNARMVGNARRVLASEPGPALYDALRAYETFMANTIHEWMGNSWISEEDLMCSGPVGFTEPAHRFERVRPENIGLVQLAAKRPYIATVRFDLVPSECEIRLCSKDVVVVGVWQ